MASHSYHPDTHEFGLADGCERCDQHAEHPMESLDQRNIQALMDRIIGKLRARSVNEEMAMQRVAAAMAERRFEAYVDQYD